MGTSRLGEASLCTLPEDVHLQILDLLPPSQIAVFAELCKATRATASSPSVWASVARRHLAVVPPTSATPASVAALARTLLCRWWLATGLFVPGVAVHRRSGFLAVRSRGGTEVPLSHDDADTAYVFGGRNAHRCTPTAAPAVELDFALDPAGPFPVDGLTIRLQHAAELSDAAAMAHTRFPSVVSEKAPLEGLGALTSSSSHAHDGNDEASASHTAVTEPAQRALVRVELNNVVLSEVAIDASHKFCTLEVHVPATALACKPAVNMLAVRFDRASTAGYWLRDVTVCPSVLPLPRVTDAVVPKASVTERGDGLAGLLEEYMWLDGSRTSLPSPTATPPPLPLPGQRQHSQPRERAGSPRDAPSSPRRERARRRDSDGAAASSPRATHGVAQMGGSGSGFAELQERSLGRAAKGKTPGAKARTPKHKYHQHQHHHRSPRSPRTRGAR